MALYKNFLIPGCEYQNAFPGEKYPDLSIADYYTKNKIYFYDSPIDKDTKTLEKTQEMDINNFRNSKALSIDTFINLLKTVKEKEGFPKENIDELIDDILEVNGFSKEENEMTR